MLHIHNGDSSADTAAQSTLPGEHFAFRESLVTGPTPSGLSQPDWRRTRAQHLSSSFDVELERCERELFAQEQKLAAFADHEEIVLWFEHDLFCQVHLIYLLDWFAQQDLGETKLSLICIGEFPGKDDFHGLGELNADELASLFPARKPVTADVLNFAGPSWRAYSSSTPTEIEALANAGAPPLTFLHDALRAHLRRFPSTTNGLGAVESVCLRLIQNGHQNFADLFTRFRDEEPVYGFGDAQVWLALKRLAEARQPLIKHMVGSNDQKLPMRVKADAMFSVTDLGGRVMRDEADFVSLDGIDLWLGGVHLFGDAARWRWDELEQRIVLTDE